MLLAAIAGRCPACQEGRIKSGWITINTKCSVCEVRFERWEGTWTIAAVMGYGSAAVFAVLLGLVFFRLGALKGAENIIIPATMLFAAVVYPICKNISIGLLFLNGFIYPDPPALLPAADATLEP